ncbi:MAG: AraC family transcriptional regulator [Pseudomonadota bacterium]|jgi:AraC-like DNA-binding protein
MSRPAAHTSGTLSARMLARTFEFCRRRGHDASPLFLRAGVSPSLLADPEARVPYAVVAQISEGLFLLTGDDNFGLHLAADVQNVGEFDAGLLLLMASESVRAALDRMVEQQRYWGDGQRMTSQPRAGGIALRYQLAGAQGAHARHAHECMMAEVALGLRALTGQPLCARHVSFQHAAPRSTHEHQTLFGCALSFSAEHTEIELDDAVLDTPMPHANAAFCAIFAQQVTRALARLPATCSSSTEVRAAVHAALASGRCTVEGTARALAISTRTLQRRLQDEGTSFAGVVEAVRRELSVAYLERGISIVEVAALLGYADTTAFHHAFRRWHGTSPAEHNRS